MIQFYSYAIHVEIICDGSEYNTSTMAECNWLSYTWITMQADACYFLLRVVVTFWMILIRCHFYIFYY